ncbi:SRPBCC family protein [Nocardia stercoris]|uniref:SRPBCC family protein n=1 Tax=Nocardia stercoris TaxID=2483361 RepID=A0A3M2L9L1_9NOCA|nr:SRPBCC family protein [Nocardia stercoris]
MRLYSVIADTATWGDWFQMHGGFAEAPPTNIGVNSKLAQNIRLMGMTQRLDLTVVAFKPPMELTLAGSSPAGITCEFTFAIARRPGGCELTIAGDFDGPVLTEQLSQLIENDAQTQLAGSMDKLHEITGSAS